MAILLGAFSAALAALAAVEASEPGFALSAAAAVSLLAHVFVADLLPAALLALALAAFASRARTPGVAATMAGMASALLVFALWIGGTYSLAPRGLGPDPALGDPHRRGRALPRGRGASRFPRSRVRTRGQAAAARAPPRLRGGGGPRAPGRDPASLLPARAASRPLAPAFAAVRACRRAGGGRARSRRRRQERAGGRGPRRRRHGLVARGARLAAGDLDHARHRRGPGRPQGPGAHAREAARLAACRCVLRGEPAGTCAGSGRGWDSWRMRRCPTPTGGASTSGRSRRRPESRASRWDGGPPGRGPGPWSSKTARCSPGRRTARRRPRSHSRVRVGCPERLRPLDGLPSGLRHCARRSGGARGGAGPGRRASAQGGRSSRARERSSSWFSPPTRILARALWGVSSSSTARAHPVERAPTAVPARKAPTAVPARKAAGPAKSVQVLPVDAAPSILARVGIPPARDLAGRPVASLFAPGTLETATVPSYGPRVAPPASTAPKQRPGVSGEAEESGVSAVRRALSVES